MLQKLMIMTTVGAEDPEKATFPVSLAVNAQAIDIEVTLCVLKEAVRFALRDGATEIVAHGMPALQGLVDTFFEAGGKMLVCTPCMTVRGIKPEELLPGATVAGGAAFVAAAMEADKVMTF